MENFSLQRIIGMLILIGGLIYGIYYYNFFDTSVSVPSTTFLGQTFGGGRVNNMGLMQDKQNGMIVGFVAAGFGLLILLAKK